MKHTIRDTTFKITQKQTRATNLTVKATRVSKKLHRAIAKKEINVSKRVKLNESTFDNLRCADLEMPKEPCTLSTSVNGCSSLLQGSTSSLNEMSLLSQLSTSCSNFDEESVSLSCFAVAPHNIDEQ